MGWVLAAYIDIHSGMWPNEGRVRGKKTASLKSMIFFTRLRNIREMTKMTHTNTGYLMH